MKISTLDLLNCMKKRARKVQHWLEVLEQSRKEEQEEEVIEEQDEDTTELQKKYLLIEQDDKKLDILNTLQMKQLQKERTGHKQGKSRWLVHTREQLYKPREFKVDPKLEYLYDESALSENFDITTFGP